MASSKPGWPVWVAAAAGLGLAAWASLHWLSPGDAAAPAAPMRSTAMDLRSGAARAAASPAMPPAPAPAPLARIQVQGIVSTGAGGLAVIAVGGAPARTFRIGDAVDGELVLRGIASSGVTLGRRDGSGPVWHEAAPPLAGNPAPAMPTAGTGPAPVAQAGRGPTQAQESPDKAVSRYGPIAQQVQAPPGKAGAAPVPPVDDGRWRPANQP